MASWKKKFFKSVEIDDVSYKIWVPIDIDVPEFEIIAVKGGREIDRVIGWDSHESYIEIIERMHYC